MRIEQDHKGQLAVSLWLQGRNNAIVHPGNVRIRDLDLRTLRRRTTTNRSDILEQFLVAVLAPRVPGQADAKIVPMVVCQAHVAVIVAER